MGLCQLYGCVQEFIWWNIHSKDLDITRLGQKFGLNYKEKQALSLTKSQLKL